MSGGPNSERDGARVDALITDSTLVYRIGRDVSGLLLKTLARLRVDGRARAPRDGGLLVVCNHQSFLDIPIVAWALRPRHVAFVARESLRESRALAFLMRHSGAILIRRGTADRQALKEMVEHLTRGDVVCVFPEGTRTHDGSLGEFREGALFAAKRARVPILPAGIRGAMDVLPRGAMVPRPRPIAISFGEPIDGSRRDAMQLAREAIAAIVGDGRFSTD